MKTTMYTVGLTHDERDIAPIAYEQRLSTLSEVYAHCVFIAEQLGLALPLDEPAFYAGVQEKDENGVAFVTIDFPKANLAKQLVIVFERSDALRDSPARARKRLRSHFLQRG